MENSRNKGYKSIAVIIAYGISLSPLYLYTPIYLFPHILIYPFNKTYL